MSDKTTFWIMFFDWKGSFFENYKWHKVERQKIRTDVSESYHGDIRDFDKAMKHEPGVEFIKTYTEPSDDVYEYFRKELEAVRI